MRHLLVALLLAGALGHGHARMLRFEGNGIAFNYPPAWRYSFGASHAHELHFGVFLWLSTQPLHDPCTVQGDTTTCTTASDGLAPNGVLVRWDDVALPGELRSGAHVRIGGRPARLVIHRRAVVATIAVGPHHLMQMTATFRAPHLRENRARVLQMLRTVRFVSA